MPPPTRPTTTHAGPVSAPSGGLRAVRVLALAAVAIVAILYRTPHYPQHVFLISIDTLRADHLGSYGYERPTSPRLDAFAARGIRFATAVAHAPNTFPSHVALFTSRPYLSFPISRARYHLPESALTIAETLRQAGFRTAGFVDGGYLDQEFGLDQGFEVWMDRARGIATVRADVAEWLDEHTAPGTRLFAFVHCYDVHSPYGPPPTHESAFVGPPPNGFVPTTESLRSAVQNFRPLSPEERAHVIDRYDAGIRYTDGQIGALLDDLAARGILDDSVVIITSDHGEAFGEHRSLLHWQLYFRPNLHVPLLLSYPGAEPAVVDDPVGLIDVYPTIVDLLGLPPVPGMHGRSLVSPPDDAEARRLYVEPFAPDQPSRALVTATHQFLLDGKRQHPSLFDLREDPYSMRNVRRRQPRIAQELRAELTAYRAAVDAARNDAAPAPRPKPLTPELRRALDALGYAE